MHDLDVTTRRHKEKRIWRYALLGSALLHLLVLLLGGDRSMSFSPGVAAGPEAGDDRAAAGGLQVMAMTAPPPPPIERPIIPVPVDIELDPVEFSIEQAFDAAAVLGERPGFGEVGIDTGDGAGNGGTDPEGRDPTPAPRGMILPVDTPRNLRGFELKVWVFVNERGVVVADSTWLDPPSRDRRYNQRVLSEAAEWSFNPAVRDGVPVAAWFSWLIKN